MSNTIRQYKNNLWLNFEQRGENFTLSVPHKNVWDSIIRFLRKRGWKITENPSYKEHFNSISKYHKIGFKGEVTLLMEITPISIKIEFGNKKNLSDSRAQIFWQKEDAFERYHQLTYLQEKAVEIEIFKTKSYCQKWCELEKCDNELSAIEFILDKESRNTHIHGGAKSLDEIALYMESEYAEEYQSKHNLRDKNKNLIYCGETKFFIDYRTKRVFKGIVYHNINNMWWVLLPDGVLRNIACFELFDWNPAYANKRVLGDHHQIKLLDSITEKALKDRDYKKVSKISSVIEKLRKEASHV
ncbi:hypothetical protein [Belliella pelovolcani]|uniref:hypothetical protein n=1 Tax=Belliella pelovolcani TaxID=529505 RepID=UPI003919202D